MEALDLQQTYDETEEENTAVDIEQTIDEAENKNTDADIEQTIDEAEHKNTDLYIEEPEQSAEIQDHQTDDHVEEDSKPSDEEPMNTEEESNLELPTPESPEQKYEPAAGDVAREADEIVQKLCKNGKIMQFQEGEDFIKVIVYEDSNEENNDNEDTASGEESDKENESQTEVEQGTERMRPRNLLECLTESQEHFLRQQSETHQSNSTENLEHRTPGPRYEPWMQPPPSDPRMSSAVTREAIQTNFSHTMTQFAPGFLPCSTPFTAPHYIPQAAHAQSTNPHIGASVPQQTVVCTPHPSNGYMFYVAEENKAPSRTPLGSSNSAFSTPVSAAGSRTVTPKFQNVQLNSSGEEMISPPDNTSTPISGHSSQPGRALIPMPQFDMDECGKIRELHNQKERRRRARIKEACNLLRQLVPGMSDKTDKATVFEFAARYVHFLKSHTGNQFDKDFLMKYSPY